MGDCPSLDRSTDILVGIVDWVPYLSVPKQEEVMPKLNITIDTREQTPWHFPEWVARTTVGTVKTGDYCLDGDVGFAIERKSLDDFCGTISSGWERFLREIDRMDGWPAKVIMVEADFESLLFRETVVDGETVLLCPEHKHFMVNPGFVMKRIGELTMMGVSVLFAGDADMASALAVAIFRQRQMKLGFVPEG